MNKKSIIAIAVAVICIIAGGIGYPMVKGYMIKKDPVNYLLYASTQNNSNAVDASMKGTFSMDDEALNQMTAYMSSDPEAMSTFVKGIVEELNFDGRVKFGADLDNNKIDFYENIGIQYGQSKLLSLELGYIDEQLFYSMPEVYSKAFAMTKSELFDLIKETQDIDLSQVKWESYLDLLKMEKDPDYQAILKDKAKYEEIIRLFLADLKANGKTDVTLENGTVLKCDLLETDISFKEILDLYVQLFKTVKEDQNVKTLVKKKALAALDIALETEDYKLMMLEETDVKDAIESINTDFDTKWNEMMDELIKTYEEIQSDATLAQDVDIKYHMAFAIDNKYNLRQYQMKANTNGILVDETVIYNAYGDDVKFDETLAAEETVSVKDMILDPDYMETVTEDVISKGLSAFLSSDAFVATVNDIKEKAAVLPAEESQQIIESLDYVLNNQEMIINMMLGQY
ncbi:hypothetical protein [Fusibacter ferrireducens]|uniref:Uncharacterized protein n=1 Tax=Fusibacter ferrireducens TaxID=2785058 RepID=A0ABR9ZZ39_9FIRM|nr:hypothetical protein [Fusibacter ferrireducens]MBF4695726.1 hypothetical protein [Fusibacter ferrireducens]